MKKSDFITHSLFLSLVMAFVVVLPNQLFAKETYNLIFAHTGIEEQSTYWAAEEFKRRVEKYSDGQIQVDTKPASQMGSDKKLLEMCKQGSIDIASSSNGNYAHIGRAFLPLDLPYIVHGHYNWYRVMTNNNILEKFKQRVEKDGLKFLMAYPDGGERHIVNSERIVKTPSEANGMKLRVVASPINQNLVTSWGFNPVSIAWSETYQAVQQGVVRGVYLPNTWSYISKIYEVAKYVTETGGIGIWHVDVMNLERYNNLPKDLQKVVDRAATEARLAAFQHDQYWSKKAKEKMEESGVTFYEPTQEESRQWIEAAKKIWDPMIDKLGIDREFVQQIQDAQIPFDQY
jgi:C4-dicarboxylate-binding protein DctP